MMSQARQYAKRSRNLIIAYKIYQNWRMRRRFSAGDYESLHGSTHSKLDIVNSLRYINEQYEDYLTYGKIRVESLSNKRVFELGFGDNLGVALRFLADGAAHVTCLDKFYSKRDNHQQRKIYQGLRQSLNLEQQRRFDNAVDLTSGTEIDARKLKCIYGFDVESCDDLNNTDLFDLVISRAVIQDIYDPRAAFAAMDKLLRKGGSMLHKIDISDQGMFRDNGMNPLTFLTIAEPLYRKMAVDSAISNRKLIDWYKAIMAEMGYSASFLITDVCGTSGKGDLRPHQETLNYRNERVERAQRLVAEIRPRLAPDFRELSDEELMIAGVFLVATKQ
jgi:hypothetical protein